MTDSGDADRMPSWAPEGIDWRKPSVARVYDVHLGGAHNFAVDREVAAELARVMPELPALFRANRSFLRRAVRFLVDAGITQFLDLGSGIPTAGNVHEIAQAARSGMPGGVRGHRSGRGGAQSTDPGRQPARRGAARGSAPTGRGVRASSGAGDDRLRSAGRGVVGGGVELRVRRRSAGAIIERCLEQVPSGSYLGLSHPTHGTVAPTQSQEAAELYRRDVDNIVIRDRAQIESWVTRAGTGRSGPGLHQRVAARGVAGRAGGQSLAATVLRGAQTLIL